MKLPKDIVCDLVAAAGVAVIVVGVWWASPSASMVIAGSALVYTGWSLR